MVRRSPLRRIGRPARVLTGATSGFMLAAVVLGTLMPPEDAPPQPDWTLPAPGVLAALCLWLVVRSPFLGVRVTGDRLVVRSWFSTRSLDRARIVGVTDRLYDGWLNEKLTLEFARRLHGETDSGRDIVVNVSLTTWRSSARNVELLRTSLRLPPRTADSERRAWRAGARGTSRRLRTAGSPPPGRG